MRFLRRTFRRILAAIHLARGKKLYSQGRFTLASVHVQRSLAIAGPAFTAHLYLGKIFMRLSRFDRARREFALARYLDPGRFAAQGLPEDVLLELAQRFYQPLWNMGKTGNAGSTANTGRSGTTDDEAEGLRSAGESDDERDPATVGRETAAAAFGSIHDDFASPAERERFRILPPIGAEDIDRMDWSKANELFDS